MQKRWALALGFVLILGLSFWFLKSPRLASDEPSLASSEAYGPTMEYQAKVEVRQRVDGQGEALVLALDGVLQQAVAENGDTLSRWQRIDRFALMNQEQDASLRDALIGKSIASNLEVATASYSHAFAAGFPHELIPFHASLLQRTLIPVQMDELKRSGRISLKERDEVGEYEASYGIEASNVRKRWTRYFNDSIKVDGRLNSFLYSFAKDGRLEALDGRLALYYRQSTPTRFQISIQLNRLGPSQLALPKVDAATAVVYSEADIAKGMESAPKSVLAFDEALKQLDSITDKSESAEVYRIFTSLKYGIDQDPSRAKVVFAKIDAIKSRDADARRRLSVLFGALAQAQDSAISSSLAELAETCPDNYCKIQAIAGVNSHPHPSAEALDKMLDLARTNPDQEIAGNALLAAGAAGSRMDQAGSALSETLIQLASDPAKSGLKTAALAAMGNHGSVEYLATLQTNLSDASPSIRAAAAYSMRYIPDSSVDAALLGTIAKESNALVVRDALKALDYRTLSSADYEAIAKTGAKISDTETQRIAARVLLQAYREDPGVAGTGIEMLMASTQDPDVKEYLANEVEQMKQEAAETPPAP